MAAKTATNRSFGLLIAAVLGIIGALHYWARGADYSGWIIAALFFLLVSFSMPRLLYPLKRLWLKLGHVLSVIVSPIALGVLYLVSIVTVGLLMRLFGQDPLSLRRDPAVPSYWKR